MEYIYSRVSTDKQKTSNQLVHLCEKHPNAIVYEETASGIKEREKLQELLCIMTKGDTLIIAALDRLGRKTLESIQLIENLYHRGINVISLREKIDYSNPNGRLIAQIMCSIAEHERNIISDRTKQALAALKKQGKKLGPARIYDDNAVNYALSLLREGKTYRTVSYMTGISLGHLVKLRKQDRNKE